MKSLEGNLSWHKTMLEDLESSYMVLNLISVNSS